MYDFAKETNFDVKSLGRKSNRDSTLIKLLKSPAIMASGISKANILSSYPNELCNTSGLVLQEKPARITSDISTQKIVAIVDKLMEYKCMSKREHKQILIKCNLLHD